MMICLPIDFLTETNVVLPGITSLTGGGGKTTLLFTLGKGFAARNKYGIGTTTTKMFRPLPEESIELFFTDTPEAIPEPDRNFLFAAKDAHEGKATPSEGQGVQQEKVYGYTAHEITVLSKKYPHLHIIVEADGAARKPLKAPASHEPVIPITSRAVIAVIGLSCLYKPLLPEYVFRTEYVSSLTGLTLGETITPEAVAKVITHTHGLFKNAPQNSLRYLFCNQSDISGGIQAAQALGEILLDEHRSFLQGIYYGALEKDGLRCVRMTK